MNKSRLEAFSDGVIAIIITVMVLELRAPAGESLASLRPVLPSLLTYLLSFIFIGSYWTNHHHMLHTVTRTTGGILWANLHLLFWLSLIPFATSWMGQVGLRPVPTATYGVLFVCAGVAYAILERTIIASQGAHSRLQAALGADRKGKISVALYALGAVIAVVEPRLSAALYAAVAIMWLVPDRRIESRLVGDLEDQG